ncbi:uncharacterized protein LOC119998094 isoform X2 [Tripterygium wilfordii]|uniref:uncharacterized protein LOC119998094 isoform X2 n=1 Tax=Tripterygium wilfordii TaxID=458696 RepID=UPI0018F83401|nr:uncharacterized protein LOC119998094 isoform X2 [Tripterygium wilfordii]XP_038701241.1 uncharacterized protein LOC119998094 isoform X2 [Tripterygium wilfordii]
MRPQRSLRSGEPSGTAFPSFILAIKPPLPKICGTPDGPPVTAPRIKLSDGRHLAYKEHGVSKRVAKHKIIFVHPFDTCRHDAVIATFISPELVQELGVYILSFDRPGYGESDPHPKQSVKSLSLDIEELADKLRLGYKFYVSGYSLGAQLTWGVLKYIPHRLAGVTLIAPTINYWWPGFPANLSAEAYNQQLPQDQWNDHIAHYAPWLLDWWMTQKLFSSSSAAAHREVLSAQDKQVAPKIIRGRTHVAQVRQQGVHESIIRDMKVSFGSWEFDIMDLQNPFPSSEVSVHLWQGDEDRIVPVALQRYIAQRLPWIHYHEVSGSGHLLPYVDGMCDAVIKTMLTWRK